MFFLDLKGRDDQREYLTLLKILKDKIIYKCNLNDKTKFPRLYKESKISVMELRIQFKFAELRDNFFEC